MIYAPETEETRQPLTVACPDCHGSGEVYYNQQRDHNGVYTADSRDCPECRGTGTVTADRAMLCGSCRHVTIWTDQHCPEHDDLCDECRPRGCGDCSDE